MRRLACSVLALALGAAGRNVTLGPRSSVAGNGWLTGQDVRVGGIVERPLRIAAGSVVIAGEIRQPLDIVAERLEVLATARDARAARSPPGLSSVLFTIHLFVGGLLLLLVVPRFAAAPAEMLRAQPWRSLVTGVVLAVTIPFVAVLFLVSFVGIPVGLTMGAVCLAALFVAVVTTAVTLGFAEARLLHKPLVTRSREALFLLAGVVTLAVLRSLPIIGGGVVFVSILFGLGALGLWSYRAYTRLATPAPAAS
jgi:hypothetical protein